MKYRIDPSEVNTSEFDTMEALVAEDAQSYLVSADGKKLELPKAFFKLLEYVLVSMKERKSIVLISEDEAYTTQAAANFLGVSRQHIVDLLKEDKIPYHNVGSHRRIMIKDLLAYAENRKREKTDALNDLFDEVNKAGKYDASYLGHIITGQS